MSKLGHTTGLWSGRRRSRSGLSLVEVVVSISILLVMSVSVGAVFGSGIELRTILEDRDVSTRAARAALSTIRRELQLAYLTDQNQSLEFYQTVFVGLDGSTDTLYFATRGHQRLYRDARESDQSEVTLWTESARDGSRGYTLYHRESSRVDGEPGEGGTVYPLAMNVRSFELRYLDGVTDEWQTEWDSRGADFANRLPRAVQIGLVLIGIDPQDDTRTVDIPFFTTVLLQYADPLPRQGMSLAVPPGGGSQQTAPTAPLRGGPGPGATPNIPGMNPSALGGGRR
jgi:general secretion pathway protein J